MTVRPRRWLVLALAPLIAVTAMLVAPATSASADPDGTSATADDGDDNPLLNDVLESTGRRYLTAKTAVEQSTKRQLTLAIEVRQLLVVHYYRVGLRKIRDRPFSARVS